MRNMTCMEIVPYSGDNLRILRDEQCKLSRKKLADLSGVGESSIQAYEENRRAPNTTSLAALGKALSKKTGREIVFTSEWSAQRIKEYGSPNID